ncbi:MAG: hypothetical protein WAT19_14185 [Ferruginibacter sp.]
MKRIIILTGILFFGIFTANAQKAAKSVFAELAGPGLASINFDMRFQQKEDGLGFRAGIGGFSVRSTYYDGTNNYTERTSIVTIPLGLNYLLGKDNKHYFELGAGATIVTAKNRDGYTFDNERFTGSFGHLNFGYRLQPKEGGFLFRAAINPIFGNGYFIPYYAGIAFGYKF